jgi:tryptophan synthase alpha chain
MRLTETTTSIRRRGERALVPFFTAGYPDETTFRRLTEAACGAGCRIIEIGIPFSDPIADGPVIQASSRRALEQGMTLARALGLIEDLARHLPASFVVMSYLNPILRMGEAVFARRAGEAGVSGVIVPDLPREESRALRAALRREGIDLVDLIAPTSSTERIARIARTARGFLYLVSLTGVTGVRDGGPSDVAGFVARIRARSTLPLYVGFGISTPAQAATVAAQADGVIVGSALIRIIQSCAAPQDAVARVSEFLREMREAMAAGDSPAATAGEETSISARVTTETSVESIEHPGRSKQP